MGKISDLNVAKMQKSRFAATLGDAHEHIVLGLLIRLGLEVGKVDVSSTPYDLIVGAFTQRSDGQQVFLRAQIKTITHSLSLKGGSRGGKDRTYKSGIKTYKYTKDQTDLMIGIDRDELDIYVVPTQITEKFNASISKSKLQLFKNNWDIFWNWNDKYLSELEKRV